MQTKDFVQFLETNNVVVFTLEDAVKILDSGNNYASLFLHRCIEKGLIGRIKRGIYYLKKRVNEYEIASNILTPSYVSMVSALAYYGLTTQIPRFVYVISTKRHRPIRGINGFDIIFKHVKNSMMFGYHKESNGNIFIADPEKALVDIYYFNDVNDLDEDAFKRPSRLNIEKLVKYAEASKSKHVMRSVAGLLYAHKYSAESNRLANLLESIIRCKNAKQR